MNYSLDGAVLKEESQAKRWEISGMGCTDHLTTTFKDMHY